MKVSVIIPVYNAQKYVRLATESALSQEETGEVILVDDASNDNSFDICMQLKKEYKRVKLLTHEGRINCGIGQSRNLGIKAAKYDCIAFLDADDFYLPKRFKNAKELLEKHHDIDGVYEAVSSFFENEEAHSFWLSSSKSHQKLLMTLTERVSPEKLFEFYLQENTGWCHLNGITLKKSVFKKIGYFGTERHEDTVMFVKLSLLGTLIPGTLRYPVSMRRIHTYNNTVNTNSKHRLLLWKTLFKWGYKNGISISKLDSLLYKYIYNQLGLFSPNRFLVRKIKQIAFLFFLCLKYPKVLKQKSFWLFLLLISKLNIANQYFPEFFIFR